MEFKVTVMRRAVLVQAAVVDVEADSLQEAIDRAQQMAAMCPEEVFYSYVETGDQQWGAPEVDMQRIWIRTEA